MSWCCCPLEKLTYRIVLVENINRWKTNFVRTLNGPLSSICYSSPTCTVESLDSPVPTTELWLPKIFVFDTVGTYVLLLIQHCLHRRFRCLNHWIQGHLYWIPYSQYLSPRDHPLGRCHLSYMHHSVDKKIYKISTKLSDWEISRPRHFQTYKIQIFSSLFFHLTIPKLTSWVK